MTRAAILVIDSQNTKLGERVAATYVSITASCPDVCPLRDAGCYAQDGHVAFVVRRLDAAAVSVSRLEAAQQEAKALDAARPDGRPLRLHVAGDSSTPEAASVVASAAGRWVDRGGGPVWSYTHAWRDVPRSAWTTVSILASCDTALDGAAALEQGYAPAVVTGPHPMNGRAYERAGVRWIPCPSQTRGVTCERCRLCWDADALRARGAGIAFAAHSRPRRVLQLVLAGYEPEARMVAT